MVETRQLINSIQLPFALQEQVFDVFAETDGSNLLGASHAETPSAGTILDKFNQTFNPIDAPWLASGNGASDDRAALAAADAYAVSQGAPLFITKRHRIASNLTIQSNLVFIGGTLEPSVGVTVTCSGLVEAGLQQIFAGLGSVVGVRWVRPEWFGAVRNGTVDDAPAFNKAWACLAASATSNGNCPTIYLSSGTYAVASTIKVAPTLSVPLKFIGQGWAVGGTRFEVLSTFATTNGTAAIHIDGSTDAIQKSTSIEIGGFAVIPYTAGATLATCGMQVGTVGKDLIGVQQSQIRDVHISDGFTAPFRLLNFRLIDFNRCSTWNRTISSTTAAMDFLSDATGPLFCGDINFNDCQFVGWLGAGLVRINPSTNLYEVKGVRFNNCIFYYANKSIDFSPSSGAQVGDIWINPGCQFDGFQRQVINIAPDGSGTVVDNIHFDGIYIRGVNTGYNAIGISRTNSARVDSIWVVNSWFANIANGSKAFVAQDCSNIHFSSNSLTEVTATAAQPILLAQSVSSFIVSGNLLRQVTATTVQYLVTIGSGCDYGAVVNNSTNGSATSAAVQNLSAGIHLTTSPNW